jgi:hypothetical protein
MPGPLFQKKRECSRAALDFSREEPWLSNFSIQQTRTYMQGAQQRDFIHIPKSDGNFSQDFVQRV